jgi:hypothetical protein
MKLKHILEAFTDPVLRESYWGTDYSDYYKQFSKHRKENVYFMPGVYGKEKYAQGLIGAIVTPYVNITADNSSGTHNFSALAMQFTNYNRATDPALDPHFTYFLNRFDRQSFRFKWEKIVTTVEEDVDVDSDELEDAIDDLATEFMQRYNQANRDITERVEQSENGIVKGAFSFRRFIWGKMNPTVGAVKNMMTFIINAIQKSKHKAVLAERPHAEHGVTVYDTHYNTPAIMQRIIKEHFKLDGDSKLLSAFANASLAAAETKSFWNDYSRHWFFIDNANPAKNIIVLQKSDLADLAVIQQDGEQLAMIDEPQNEFNGQILWALEFEQKYPHMDIVREYVRTSPDLVNHILVVSDEDMKKHGAEYFDRDLQPYVNAQVEEYNDGYKRYEQDVDAARDAAIENDEEFDEYSIDIADYLPRDVITWTNQFNEHRLTQVKKFLAEPTAIRKKVKETMDEYQNTELDITNYELLQNVVFMRFLDEHDRIELRGY